MFSRERHSSEPSPLLKTSGRLLVFTQIWRLTSPANPLRLQKTERSWMTMLEMSGDVEQKTEEPGTGRRKNAEPSAERTRWSRFLGVLEIWIELRQCPQGSQEDSLSSAVEPGRGERESCPLDTLRKERESAAAPLPPLDTSSLARESREREEAARCIV